MKILMLGWELPPHNSGGLGIACLELSKAMASAGADISFILPYSSDMRYDFMEVIGASEATEPIPYAAGVYDSYKYMLDGGGSINLGLHDQQALYAHRVGRLSEKLTFDVVHAHDWLTFRAALLLKEKHNCPIVLHVHSIERDRAGGQDGNPFVREIEAESMLLADHVFAVSQRTKDMIVEDYGIPADKIEVAHNSIDLEAFEFPDADNAYKYLSWLKQRGWRVVTNAGRLTVQKGLTHLLAAAKEVVARQPKTIFLIVGGGEMREELIRLAAENGIGANVIFTGFQRGKQLRDAFSVADLFVLPSISEPFGLTPFEAAGYGTPSLISRQSGASEVLRNCLKVDYWDINLMADRIVGALRSQPLLDELSRNAQEEFYRLSWNDTASKILRRYENVLTGAAA
ncbi:MAG TPA: glycosyltransferase family 4 protein [Candidatus Saccharimonadales bacterium]|nr:glycosyltransferase family 4 protein [Candidatus Saccharimonadales bacterium]